MPIKSLIDISGGITNRPPRTSPQNTVDEILNAIANVDNNAIVSCAPYSFLFTTAYPYATKKVVALTVISNDSGEMVLLATEANADYYYKIFGYNGSFDSQIVLVLYGGTNTLPVNLLAHRFGGLFHNAANFNDTYFDRTYIRQIYDNKDYRKFYDAIGDNGVYKWRSLPSPNLQLEEFNSFTIEDDYNCLFNKYEMDFTGGYILKYGINIDNVQSITTKFGTSNTNVNYLVVSSATDLIEGLIKLNIVIDSEQIHDRVSGLDLYLAKLSAPYDGDIADLDSFDWKFIQTVDFDYEEVLYDFTEIDLSEHLSAFLDYKKLDVGNSESLYFSDAGQTSRLVIEFIDDDGNSLEYVILSNTSNGSSAEYIYFSGADYTGLTGKQRVKIKSKWYNYETSVIGSAGEVGLYGISVFIHDITGEALIQRCGVSDRKIENIEDYCPPALHCCDFKGFLWLADYYEYNETRRNNRLIRNVVNSDGNSCYDVYDVNVYYEFPSQINALVPLRDYLLVFTNSGIYSMTFVPPTGTYDETWTFKEVSKMSIQHKKMISNDNDRAIFCDYSNIYYCDGLRTDVLTTEEQSAIIKENVTVANKTALQYSLLYSAKNQSILLFLDNILRFKGGLFLYSIGSGTTFTTMKQYNGEHLLFLNGQCNSISEFNEESIVSQFNVTSYNDDLGTKEDKILNELVLFVDKSGNGSFVLSVYLDDTLIKQHTFAYFETFSDKLTIVPKKSKTRRFNKIKYTVELTSGTGIIKVQYCDVDYDLVRKTVIGEEYA